jgi:hypothetical protein
MRGAPIGVYETDENLVLPPALDQQVVSGIALDDEAKATQQAPTPFVGRQVRRLHPVQSKLVKRVSDDRDDRLAHETLALPVFPNGVPQVAVVRGSVHDVVKADVTYYRCRLALVEQEEFDGPPLGEIIVVPRDLLEPERLCQEIGRQ